MNTILVLYIVSLFLIADACTNHKTCKQCVTDPSLCVWCTATDPEYDKEPRCRPQGSYAPSWCSGQFDEPKRPSITNITQNNDFSSKTGAEVQIKPQMYEMRLRPGQPLEFPFSFRKATDYPVDLYILLDASHTMADLGKELWMHSEKIYKAMQNMTKNVNMGFGTFIDKNTVPYNLKTNKNQAYSFRNQLNLTSDYTKFKETVKATKFCENYDPPEGGFDALAQVIACNVKWRENSRKIVLFLSDSPQHVAGNGRTAGIFQPFDGNCHTDEHGVYTKELEMDYPSVTNINVLAINKAVTIIFTLIDFVQETFFTSLSDIISGSKVAVLSGSDIVTLLEKIYKDISTNIKLEFEVESGSSSNYDIKFTPDCASADDYCKVESGEERDFIGTITLKEYYEQDTDNIHISVQGIIEKLTLKVDVIQCSCEEHGAPSDHCFGQQLQCGTCVCDNTRHGNRCMCTKGMKNTNDSLCVAPKTTESSDPASDVKLCSGEGECECGLCKCNKGRLGKFCECNVRSCPGYGNGTECGGHGKCTCSGSSTMCTCDKGWTLKPGAEHLGCVCDDANDLCIDTNNAVCNNRGNCTCNSCECQPIAAWDKRIEQDDFCNIKPCPSCLSMQCSALVNCVRCRLAAENCYVECAGIFLHEKIHDVLPSNLSSAWNLCQNEKLDTGCYTQFAYSYDDKANRILLLMQEDADCAENYYKFGSIILISVLLVGILTLLAWRCLTRYQDIKEFKRFESQNKEALNEPSLNPLYDEPRTFRNPAFKKSFS